MRLMIANLCAFAMFLSPIASATDEATSCGDLQKELFQSMTTLTSELQGQVGEMSEDLQHEMEDIQSDVPEASGIDGSIGLDIQVDSKLQTMKLHLPEVAMKEQTWIYHLPSITMRDQKMIFHTPGVCMKRKKVAQYPEIHGLTVKWKDVIMDVPEPCSKRQEIIIGVPEIRMEEQRTVLHVPEFAMGLQEIKMHLPEFRIDDLKAEAGKVEDKAEKAEANFQAELASEKKLLAEKADREMAPKVKALFVCYRTDVERKKAWAAAQFTQPVAQLEGAIESLRRHGAKEKAGELEQRLRELREQQAQAEQRFDENLQKLSEQELETLNRLVEGLTA